ncbi:phage tail protein [Edwardsiella piscicida]|uniref:phage tail protein n=1 Tax=Edwardsiella piscicida TaxID=1263550 RepID=UPI00370DACC7
MFSRLHDSITFFAAATVTGIGVMTISEKIALAGLLLGALSGWRAWLHRGRVERAQRRRNELIAQLLQQSQQSGVTDATQKILQQEAQDDGHTR